MKSCSILISNYNSFEAIQLCVESVRKYTRYPHKIIVCNDKCINGVDDIYLRECRDKGWLELYESGRHLTHGGSLNVLLNELCTTDYAAIIDSDTQIKGEGWLQDLINLAETDPKIIVISDYKHEGITPYGYRTGFYTLWFGLLNMNAYRDEMQVDWMIEQTTRDKKPYQQLFSYLTGIPKPDTFNDNLVLNDPGSKLWLKVNYDNPKGYRAIPIPQELRAKYRHYGHISMISIPHPSHSDQVRKNREERFAIIKSELLRLRCQR